MKKILAIAGVVILAAVLTLAVFANSQRQKADNRWDPKVIRPAFTTTHPLVVIDEAHHNAHTAGGKYRPFARLLKANGYNVVKGEGKFTPENLAKTNILVIVNAAGGTKPQILGINLPIPVKKTREMPAFKRYEIRVIRSWVELGGSLLLIADHAPFGESAKALAAAFGIRMNGGYVEVPNEQSDPLLFTSENGRLGDHPIISGESADAAVKRIMTFTGQSLDGPPKASVLLRLPDSAIEYVPEGTGIVPKHAGKAQGLALSCRQGRIVVLGEAAMLTAQTYKGSKFGMNSPGNDNRQLAINIMHWLSHRL
ncbi:MAG: hypothetical protein QME66_09140 [Candidatus Eisenbacteria bacterium]|nr:hypothetical protein [Candidatus Eisenbacteria bacterium]